MFFNFLESKVLGPVTKVTNTKYFDALKCGFLAIMPLTIIGSLFLLITDFPIPGYSEFMGGIFGEDWASYLDSAYRATFNSMGLLLSGTLAYRLAQSYKLEPLSTMIISLVAYIVVLPKSVISESGEVVEKVLSFRWLGTEGVITALIMGFISVEVVRLCVRKNFVIKMPKEVPPMVAQSFSALIPGIMVVTVSLIISGIARQYSSSFPELIYMIIQIPLQGLTSSVWAIALVAGLNGFLWWFGIHPTVVNSIVNPLLNANSVQNLELFKQGSLTLETGNVGTIQMIDQFATIGGAGVTIGLVIATFIVARSTRLKTMRNLVAAPSLFNINEPIIFGIPMVFNPLMIIPLTLAPVISVFIAYFSIKIGFMPMFNGVIVPWPTPPLISGFLVAGWQGAVTQIVCIIAAVMIYLPFVKALDRQYVEEEKDMNG